jgi:hypothetical protein
LYNGDLGLGYDSLEALSAHPDIRRFTEWVRGKPPTVGTEHGAGSRRGRIGERESV